MTTPDTSPDAAAMLAKVRKLLAKAEDSATTPAEAEAYNAKATELIAAYGIDRALLALSDPSLDIVGDRVIGLDRPYAADKLDLLVTVALAFGCRAVRRTTRGPHTKELSVHLFGHRSDLDRTELLFTSLLVQAMHVLARTRVPVREHPAAFRRSWLAGFTASVGERLRASEDDAATQAGERFSARGTTSALVLADRSQAVARAVAETYPALGMAGARRLSGSGHADGWSAGRRADLGESRLSASRRALRSAGHTTKARHPKG